MSIPFPGHLPDIPDGSIELRIHGVSGTPPSSLLKGYPIQLTGDKRIGVFRRIDGDRDRAFWWGGLTSGSWVHAFWLLLFPFAFLNVAGWMFPRPDVEPGDGWNDPRAKPTVRWRRRLVWRTLLIRLIAVGSSMVFAGVLMTAIVDTAALGAGTQVCGVARISIPGACWWARLHPVTRLGIAATLVPALIGAVAFLARYTRGRFEAKGAEAGGLRGERPEPAGVGPPGAGFHRSAMWSTSFITTLLAACHLAAAFGLLAWIMLSMVPTWEGTFTRWLALIPIAVGVAVVISVSASESEDHARRSVRAAQASSVGAGLLVVLGVWRVTRVQRVDDVDITPIARALGLVVGGVIVLLLLQTALSVLSIERGRRTPELAVLVIGTGSLFAFGSGVVEAIAWLAGATPDVHHVVRAWLAVGFLVTAALGASVFLWKLRPLAAGTKADSNARLRAAVKAAPDLTLSVLGWTPIVFLFVLVVAGALLEWTGGGGEAYRAGGLLPLPSLDWIDSSPWATVAVLAVPVVVMVLTSQPAMSAAIAGGALVGGWILVGSETWTIVPVAIWTTLFGPLAAVIYLMARGRTDLTVRRGVGIVWDLAVFWPRWFHPWAPPPYTEVAVPDLLDRLEVTDDWCGDEGENRPAVIVSAHSQGAVIAFAGLRAVASDRSRGLRRALAWDRLRLFTYGNLVADHYRRLFPSFFGPEDVAHLDERLGHRWINLYRLTDPLGQPIPELRDARTPGRDRQVIDPGSPDEPLGHSDYLRSPGYQQALEELIRT